MKGQLLGQLKLKSPLVGEGGGRVQEVGWLILGDLH